MLHIDTSYSALVLGLGFRSFSAVGASPVQSGRSRVLDAAREGCRGRMPPLPKQTMKQRRRLHGWLGRLQRVQRHQRGSFVGPPLRSTNTPLSAHHFPPRPNLCPGRSAGRNYAVHAPHCPPCAKHSHPSCPAAWPETAGGYVAMFWQSIPSRSLLLGLLASRDALCPRNVPHALCPHDAPCSNHCIPLNNERETHREEVVKQPLSNQPFPRFHFIAVAPGPKVPRPFLPTTQQPPALASHTLHMKRGRPGSCVHSAQNADRMLLGFARSGGITLW